eukprot:scaffold105129_cov24-Attheya_sp.AAC.1
MAFKKNSCRFGFGRAVARNVGTTLMEHNICSARTSAFVGMVGKSAKGHGAVLAIPRVRRTSSLSRNL